MDIQNIALLAGTLVEIGFDESIGQKLLQHACFNLRNFNLTERLLRGNDLLTCSLFFEQNEGAYLCGYYNLSLLSAIDMPDLTFTSVDVNALKDRMAEIDWNCINEKRSVFQYDIETTWQTEKEIETIVTDLCRLSEHPKGKCVADYLKLRYWSGILPSSIVGSLGGLKTKFEVSQRFFFVDGRGISLDEAYRFLRNRSIEKRIQINKKSRQIDILKTESVIDSSNHSKSRPAKKQRAK